MSRHRVQNPSGYPGNRNCPEITREPMQASESRKGRDKSSHLNRTNIDRAVYQVIADLQFWVCCKDFTRHMRQGSWRVSGNRLIVEAFRRLRVQNKYRRVATGSEQTISTDLKNTQAMTYFVRCLAPLSFTTIVMIASLFVLRRSLCTRTTSSIRMLLTRSPVTKTKSLVTSPRVYISRKASPGENVSFAVRMGTILIPDPDFDHFDSLKISMRHDGTSMKVQKT